MENEIIAPKTDVMFKSLFTRYVNCLKGLLSSLLDIPVGEIKELEFINFELSPDDFSNKSSRLDLVVKIDNKVVNIEIQLNKTSDFIERSLYYWASLYCRGSKKGRTYEVITTTIAINILDYRLFDDKLNKHTALIKFDETGLVMTEKFSIIFYELPKVSDKIETENSVKLWMQFFKATNKKELEMVKDTGNTAISEAVDGVYKLSREDKLRYLAVCEHMHEMDEAIKEAEKKTEEANKKTEEMKKKIERIELKLKKLNLSEDQINSILN